MLVLLTEETEYGVEITSRSMMYIPSFMEFDADDQALLRFCIRNLSGCNVGTK
jgi:hypothetical protein